MPTKTRYCVFVGVAGVHALVLGVFFRESQTLRLSSPVGMPLTAFIVTRRARPRSPVARPSRNMGEAPIAPLVAPITLAPPDSVALGPNGPAIDWDAAARRAVTAVLRRPKRKSFGFPPGGKSAITLGVPSPATPAHYAGESDRTPDGEVTDWVSANCYIVSGPPQLGEPDILKNARITRSGCLPLPGPDPGELFKSLRAYKKYHPPE
jgi:hypothetical protein